MARKLSLQERIALIYTSQGSQRAVARLLGISHQKVGRILKTGQEGGYTPTAKALRDPDLAQTVARGFAEHRRIVQAQARKDGIPYIPDVPIFYARLPKPVTREVVDPSTGEILRVPVLDPATGKQLIVPGDRIAAPNTHWLPDALRASWITATQRTKKFVAASVQSMVNLKIYFKQAEARARENAKAGIKRTDAQKEHRKKFQERIKRLEREGRALDVVMPVYTRMMPLDFAESTVRNRIEAQLRQKHQPATGPEQPGTLLASAILLQAVPQSTRPTRKTPNAPRKQKASPGAARPKARR
jgi:hypothetical protein